MKSVGKQLQEARLARNWTPELAARETKIKVDRVRDLEADDYSQFSSPTYARGFVRTYARALNLDEYRILRQLDNKLPEDDNASFVHETGLPYVPETSRAAHASGANRTALYVVLGLGFGVLFVSAFVLFQAYRAGELPRYFASGPDNSTNAAATNAAPVIDAEGPRHALAVDPNDTTHSERALPVNLNSAPAAGTPAAMAAATVPAAASTAPAAANLPSVPGTTRALPVDLASLTNAAPIAAPVAATVPSPETAPPVAAASPSAADSATPTAASKPDASSDESKPPQDLAPTVPSSTASTTADTPENENATNPAPRALPVDPSELAADAPHGAASSSTPVVTVSAAPVAETPLTTPVDLTGGSPTEESLSQAHAAKRLVLTASHDSSLRVTLLHADGAPEVLYDSVLRAGQSLAFGGHKFSISVGLPSAVDIDLDGVNYGPHSDRDSPETFTVESHQP